VVWLEDGGNARYHGRSAPGRTWCTIVYPENSMFRHLGIAVALTLAASGAAWADDLDVVALRKTGMALNNGTYTELENLMATKTDMRRIGYFASVLQRWGNLIPELFPPGSDKEPTRAKAEIWSDPAGFKKAAQTFADTAGSLAAAAKAGDAAAASAAFEKLDQACDDCHKSYSTFKRR
jgi:cytochrome c556